MAKINIELRKKTDRYRAKTIEEGMKGMPALLAQLQPKPKPKHVPAIRRKLIEEQKTPARSYIVSKLTDEVLISAISNLGLS